MNFTELAAALSLRGDVADSTLTLEWPLLLLLLPLPLIAMLLPTAARQSALHVPFFKDLQTLPKGGQKQLNRRSLRQLLLWLAWLLLLLSAARPVWIGAPISLPTEGRDFILAVDISKSMEARDMRVKGRPVPRVDAVKDVVGRFIERRQGDRMGLILFGSQPYLQVPLSLDLRTVGILLDEARLGIAGPLTAIGDAIALGAKHLRERPAGNRVLILLTDGANTAGTFDPLQAAELAAGEGVRIYTVGVGAERITVRGLFQRTVRNTELDEKTLRLIADTADGKYFRARNPRELENIYQELDALEPTAQDDEVFRPRRSLFHLPLSAALGLSLFFAAWLCRPPLAHRQIA